MIRRAQGVPRALRLSLGIALCLLGLARAGAQFASGPYIRPFAEILFPILGDEANYSQGFAAGAMLEYPVFPFLVPFARGAYDTSPLKTTTAGALNLFEGDLGLGLALRAGDSFGFRLDAMGGAANATYLEKSGSAYVAGLRLGASLRVAPAWTVSASAGLSRYYGSDSPFLTVASAGLIASYDLSMIAGRPSKLRIEEEHLDPVFPSLYAYYDDNPFGSIKLKNGEDAAIKNVTVSFNAGHYMDQPKVCAQYPSIPTGGSVTVPLTALFTDQVLAITQGIDAKGEIIVDYSYFGAPTEVRFPLDFRMHHRNAITWVDDRRAAAFVSPTNAASLWFSKYAAGIVRDRMRGDVNKNLQYALGLFEAERLYGLNYVVVPANDYSVKHADTSIIDSVQFPHQTLQNRGGDCSDLSILYASLLQSLGIQAAFITIPGHIFAAFDLGISEKEARSSFYDTGLLIFHDGHAWAPVEITMVKDGFMKAWKVGAKEWYDNVRRGQAKFYTMSDCWKVYPPAAFPDVNPRFLLPDEAETMRTFDSSLDRFVVRQIDPQVQELKTRLGRADPNELANELGILYGRYGMLKEAWTQFSDAAKGGYPSAWDNLANVAYLRKDFKLALSYYQYAQKLDASDNLALLGIARCQYELERYDLSDASYAELTSRDPEEASRFGYLASMYEGTGRAWSLSERFATTEWARPRPAPGAALAAAMPAPTAAAPAAVAPAQQTAGSAPPPAAPETAAPVTPSPAPAVAATPAAAPPNPTPETENPSSTAAGEPAAAEAAVQMPPSSTETPQIVARPVEEAAQAAPVPPPPPIVAQHPKVELPPEVAALPEDADITAVAAAAAAATAAAAKAAPQETQAPAAPAALESDRAADSSKPEAAVAPEPAPAAAPVQSPTAEAPAVAALPEDADISAKAAAAAHAEAAPAPQAQASAPLASVPATPAPAASQPSAVPQAPAVVAPEVAAPAPVEPQSAPAEAPAPEPPAAAVAPAAVASPPTPAAAQSTAEQSATTPPTPAAGEPPIEQPVVAASPVAPPQELLEGFDTSYPGLGTWRLAKNEAEQTDPQQFFSKLVTPFVQESGPYRYVFTARSEGKGWVGLGVHIFTGSVKTHKGWGEGESVLVWLTRDPVHYTSDVTRLQLYSSLRDSYMTMVQDMPVSISIFEPHVFEIDMDPNDGGLAVSIDGERKLTTHGLMDLRKGDFVVFRTIDRAVFSDFHVEAAK